MSSIRSYSISLGAVAALLLAYLVNPWFTPDEGTALRTVVTWAFWISFILLTVALFAMRKDPGAEEVQVEGPAFTRFLFFNAHAGLFWLPIRVFLGLAWLSSGIGKITNPEWTAGGAALRGYWERVAAIPEAPARPSITYEWYRDFINLLLSANAESWFAWVIMLGEIAVGVALIIGLLTGIAAFFGALMNMSFLLAGSASTNPILFTLAVGLILAWRVAGYYGADRYLLPMLGTPWKPGTLARREAGAPTG